MAIQKLLKLVDKTHGLTRVKDPMIIKPKVDTNVVGVTALFLIVIYSRLSNNPMAMTVESTPSILRDCGSQRQTHS